MAIPDELSDLDAGLLTNNYHDVRGPQTSLARADTDVNGVRSSLKMILANDSWRQWLTMDGRMVRWNAADFRKFVEADRPAGLQTPVERTRIWLEGSDLESAFEEAAGITSRRVTITSDEPKLAAKAIVAAFTHSDAVTLLEAIAEEVKFAEGVAMLERSLQPPPALDTEAQSR